MKSSLLSILAFFPLLALAQTTVRQQDSIGCIIPIKPLEISVDTIHLYEPSSSHFHSPSTYSDLQYEYLQKENAGQDPAFIIASKPGVTFVSDAGSNYGYSYFRIRGIDQTRINVMLNGVPLNEPEDQGIYLGNLPDLVAGVKRLQIRRGASATSFGVASYGGTIDMTTSTNLADSNMLRLGANLGSFSTYRGFIEGQVNNKKGTAGLYARSSYIQSKGFKENSSHNGLSTILVGTLGIKKHYFKLTAIAGNQANQMAWIGAPLDSLNDNPRFNANSPAEDDRFSQIHTQLVHTIFPINNIKISNRIFYTFLDGNYGFDLNNFIGLPSNSELFNYAFRSNWIGAASDITFYRYRKFEVTAGLTANTYNRSHTGSELALGELYQNTGFKDELSAYAQAKYSFKDYFTLHGEAQLRNAQFRYQGAVPLPDQQWTFLNYKAGISRNLPRRNGVLYYSFAKTSREPTRLDMFYGWDDLTADSTGAPVWADIPPETVMDHELGARFQTLNQAAPIHFHAKVNLFHMQFRNEIALNGAFGPSGLPLRSSVARTRRSGIELEGALHFRNPGISLIHASSFSVNQTEDSIQVFEPIITPGVIINQGIRYQVNSLELMLNARYQGKAWLDWANSAELPAYFTLDATARYRRRNATFHASLKNITNTTYYGGGYIGFDGTPLYFIQAPINFMTGFTITL